MALTIRPKVIGDQVIATSDNFGENLYIYSTRILFSKKLSEKFLNVFRKISQSARMEMIHILKLAFQEFVFYPLYMYFRLWG